MKKVMVCVVVVAVHLAAGVTLYAWGYGDGQRFMQEAFIAQVADRVVEVCHKLEAERGHPL